MGIGAHALDELHGRPLGTGISSGVLAGIAPWSRIAARDGAGPGRRRAGGCCRSWSSARLLVFGYNLELFGGLLHSDLWFGLAWGAFPAPRRRLRPALDAAAGRAGSPRWPRSSCRMGQRALSTPARALRRRIDPVSVRRHLARRQRAGTGPGRPAGPARARRCATSPGRPATAGGGAGAGPVSRPQPVNGAGSTRSWSAPARPAASPRWCWPAAAPGSRWSTRRPSPATRRAATWSGPRGVRPPRRPGRQRAGRGPRRRPARGRPVRAPVPAARLHRPHATRVTGSWSRGCAFDDALREAALQAGADRCGPGSPRWSGTRRPGARRWSPATAGAWPAT